MESSPALLTSIMAHIRLKPKGCLIIASLSCFILFGLLISNPELFTHEEETRVYRELFNHTFTMAEPRTCFQPSWHPQPVFLLVFVTSTWRNFERRQAIRETWGSPNEIMGKRIITLFLLGEDGGKTKDTLGLVDKESAKYHDILKADFIDTYKNLTLKTIMAMKWVRTYCSHASYFMKTDDDMYISYANIMKNLTDTNTPSSNFVMGYLFEANPVVRNRFSKFYMSKRMFPERVYPPYVAGSGYVMSADLAKKIYRTSLRIKLVSFEDVHIGMCMKALNITPVGNRGFNCVHIPYEFCSFREVISSHAVGPTEMHRIWTDILHNSSNCTS